MNTDPKKAIGFRPTQSFGGDSRFADSERGRHIIGWRAWVGPLLIARVHGSRRPTVFRGQGTACFTALGLTIAWTS